MMAERLEKCTLAFLRSGDEHASGCGVVCGVDVVVRYFVRVLSALF